MTGSHAPLEVGMPRTDHGAYDRVAQSFGFGQGAELSIFRHEGADVRVVVINGEPWFVARDVAAVLGYADTSNAIKQHCKGVATHHPLATTGGVQTVRVIAEPDMLRLVVNSKLPSAQRFERLVFEEILPSIRRTGTYAAPAPVALTEDEIVHRALAITARRVQALEAKVAEDAPKVEAYDALMDADGYYSMESAAKMCGIGRNTLYRRLREAGVIQPGSTLPYQKHMHHFVLTAGSWTDREGNVHPTQTTRAVARDWTIDGIFLLLAGVGLLMLLLAALTSYESIDETHPDALGSLDLLARRPETAAGGNPSPGTRTPDA